MILRLWKLVNKETVLREAYEVGVRFDKGHAVIPKAQVQGDDIGFHASELARLLAALDPAHEYVIKHRVVTKYPCEVAPEHGAQESFRSIQTKFVPPFLDEVP